MDSGVWLWKFGYPKVVVLREDDDAMDSTDGMVLDEQGICSPWEISLKLERKDKRKRKRKREQQWYWMPDD